MFSLFAVPAWACGGLVAPNGGINLVRTSTLAAYHDGVEHYVTSFEFNGEGGGEFGSIVPLPGVPTDVVKGGPGPSRDCSSKRNHPLRWPS